MENQYRRSETISLNHSEVHTIDDIKSSFQSQSVLLNDLHHPLYKLVYSQFDFDQLLIDQLGNYWFTENHSSLEKLTHIYIFNQKGDLLKKFLVNGKPTLYENEELMIVACEGTDDKGYIYLFCKRTLRFIEQWAIDGFLWDMECIGNTFYITSYFVDEDEAVIYKINHKKKEVISLGKNMFPTGILCHKHRLFISLSYLEEGNRGKIIECDIEGCLIKELELNIAPHKLYSYKNELVIHGLNMISGQADQLVYINIDTEEQTMYHSPQAIDIKAQDKHMLFYNEQSKTVIYWSHEKRKVIRVVHWAKHTYNDKKKIVKLNL
ncbi:hypothetical protein GCM10011391_11260 [Pullulanibacillus camelliae]|uniref:Uncharacterized protein n=1 Tax=Pullulanibacillus camelliae TaxID=1707096 RepID=A0A8J2VPC2_9BACL|nr:hypothetical protein [Pullulanibacillus camelliae]GGE34321.1 hypothetical protein GCM10011391_11260 [Pullulanibacillus camelliae]